MITNFYWMSSLLYGLALTGVLIHDLIIRKNPDQGEAAFRKLIFTVILFCLQDTFWGLCGSGIIANDSVFWLASTIFHSSTVLTTYIWLEYIMTFLGDKVAHSNLYMLFGKFVVCLQACLLIRNVYIPTVFHIENGVYYTDFLRPLAFADQYVVFFVMFVISIIFVIDGSMLDDIILFIDEIHTIIGAGGAEGSLDAANILKPALARGEIQVIGATTIEEYRKHIEKDAALERRFQTVMVNEPSMEECIDILKGLKQKYEEFHHLLISEAAIEEAVKLSTRYIPDTKLPDKAIDLIDEACSKIKIKGLFTFISLVISSSSSMLI